MLLSMWTNQIAPPLGLQKLGILAARLGRLATYQLVARGAAQLKAMGLENADELTRVYQEHVVKTMPIIRKVFEEPKGITVQHIVVKKDFGE